jgi:hypothetical protein
LKRKYLRRFSTTFEATKMIGRKVGGPNRYLDPFIVYGGKEDTYTHLEVV